jgi:SAM-dependent methyltransferase
MVKKHKMVNFELYLETYTCVGFARVSSIERKSATEYMEAGFDSIVFCSALHDLHDSVAALKRASSLLRPNGKLVIVHAQGASHVARQVNANPVLVKRGLPEAEELRTLDLGGLKLTVEPAKAGSIQETNDGYLAVLQK